MMKSKQRVMEGVQQMLIRLGGGPIRNVVLASGVTGTGADERELTHKWRPNDSGESRSTQGF
jgi:hypothetical protein